MTIARIIDRVGSSTPSPIFKQLATVGLYLVALTLILTSATALMTSEVAVEGSVVGITAATAIAVVATHKVSRWPLTLVVAAIDLAAVLALQSGTGGMDSVFAAFAIASLIWFGVEVFRYSVRLAVLSGLVCLVDTFFVFLLRPDSVVTNAELVRDAFSFGVMFVIFTAALRILIGQAWKQLDQSRRALEESQLHSEALAASEARARTTSRFLGQLWAAMTQQPAIGTDVTGLIDAWNPGAARLLGLSSEQTVGIRHIDDFLQPTEFAEPLPPADAVAADAVAAHPGFAGLVEQSRLGPADVRDWTYWRDDGGEVAVELSVTARVDDDDETVGYLFVAYDLTKVHEASRLKDEFIGLISHELRTPLTSILGYLELMRDDEDVLLSEQQLQYLDVTERNANRLLRLVGDLLFAAQVESGTFSLNRAEQSLAPILESSVALARGAATAAGISIRFELTDDQLVNVDAARLGQACDKLISNAIKFTPRGGTVTVALSTDQSNAVIAVTDTGIGIATDELDRLFSRFFRATTATRNAVQGVGLGLVITKAIASAHGGRISVSSEEGVGTCFTLSLPLSLPLLEPVTV